MQNPITNPQTPLATAGLIGAAVGAGLAVWAVARLAGVEIEAGSDGDLAPVGIVDVIVAAGVASIAAWLAHTVVVRAHLGRWWPFIGSTALAISMMGPSYMSDGASAMALMAMHFAVGGILIYGFAHRTPEASARHRRRPLEHR